MPSGYSTEKHFVACWKKDKHALQFSESPSFSFQLDPSIFESLQKERVEAGDVIYIEANSGAVKVMSFLGRSTVPDL